MVGQKLILILCFSILILPSTKTNLNHIANKETSNPKTEGSAKMASMTMTASFVSGSSIVSQAPAASRWRLVIACAARGAEGEKVRLNVEGKTECSNGRRDLMFAAAAATVCSVAGIAMAEGLKAGSPEARKFYAPVCVTMPTAKICRK